MLKKSIIFVVAIMFILVIIYNFAESEMVHTGVAPDNYSFMDVITYIYHGLI